MHEPLCEVLLEKLCTAVQKVQEQYASGQEVIKDSEPVNQLCQSVDEIFSHGLKEGILSWASGSETTYWPLVSKITYKEVLQNISRRPSIKTDRERCQVWVRVATQENSLGSYLSIITQDEKLLLDFYQPHAFLFDKEKVDTAKTALLYGLSHLDFNISLDIPKQYSSQTAIEASQNIPEKSNITNGYSLSYPTNSSYPNNSLNGTPSGSLTCTKRRDGHKKKKKKSSVAVIADSVDDSAGMMTSVEQYLYNLSPRERDKNDSFKNGQFCSLGSKVQEQDKDNIENDQSGALGFKNKEDIPNALSENYVLEESNFVQTDKKDEIHNLNDLTSPGDEHLQSEVFGVENLRTEIGRLSMTHNESAHYHSEGSKQNERGHDSQSDNNSGNNSRVSAPTAENTAVLLEHNDNRQTYEQLSPLETSSSKTQSSEETESQQDKENNVITIDNELEYTVSCARFEFGTPTEQSPFDTSSDRSLTELSPEEHEGFNFIPGIHKTDPWRSRSSSFGSLTGSGSFSVQAKTESERPRRSSTIDSKSSMSSSLTNESWRYVTSLLSSKERTDSRADDMSVATEDSFSELGMFEELLGMNEDHFSTPESFMGLSSSEELHHAIKSCQEMIRSTQNPEEKKKLVKRLIQLRIKLRETKDESSIETTPDAKKILGHQFVKEDDTRSLSNVLCDRCGKWIWTMWHTLFTCQECKFHSHRKCLDMIRRHCASRKVSVSSYSLNIAPENGLNAQQYKCVECRKMISLTKSGQGEARLCDYSGQYFCEDCHWNDHVVIPARIVHNWDYGTYKVSRQTKQFLDLMAKKPILNLEQLNPALFKFVGELREIKRLREQILVMKKYFLSCRSALDSKLLLHLQDKQHFVDNSCNYSLQDVLEVERGTMLPFITRVHSLFLTHIKSDCKLCRAKGFVCEMCRADEIIFAFDSHAIQCVKCRTVFHKHCFKKDTCPKCSRIQKRTPK